MSERVGLREVDAVELEHVEGGGDETFDYIFRVFRPYLPRRSTALIVGF